MKANLVHGAFRALSTAALMAALAGCDEDGSSGAAAPAPTPAAAPEITMTTPPPAPVAAGAADLTQVGAVVQVTPRTQELTFTTRAIAGQTKVRVTLPDGYDPNGTKRYPVVYLLHGGVGRFSDWTAAANGNLEALTPNVPVIFVMPDAAGNPAIGVGNYVDWFNQGAFGPPQVETYQMRQLLPWIDQNYKTVAHRNARATAGFSMGGHGAFHYARRYPDLIGVSASFSGSIDTTQPTLDWRAAGISIGRNIWGDYAAEEVRWRASGSVDSAKNLSNTNLFMSHGDTGSPENTYIRLGTEAVEARLVQFKIPYVVKKYTAASHTWATARRGFTDWLPDAVALLTDPARQSQANPASFSYTTIDTNYQVYGWNVGMARTKVEFSSLEVTDPNTFSMIGSGTATVMTAPLPQINAIYKVTLTGGSSGATKTIYIRTDSSGRAVIPVVLGPANPYQQYTAEADAGSTAAGPDAASVPFTVRGTGSRFYVVKVALAPYTT